jgi:O-antigen/teichoic acid export membrane protein
VTSTAVREVAQHASSDRPYLIRLIQTGSLFYWSAFLFVAALVYLLAPVIASHWITLRDMHDEVAAYGLRVLGIAGLTALPQRFYASLIRGLQRMHITNAVDVGTAALQQGGTIVIASAGGSFLLVATWLTLCLALSLGAYMVICASLFGWRALLPRYEHDVVQRNYAYSGTMMWVSLLAVIQAQSDKVVIGKLLPVGVLGAYGFVYGLASRASFVNDAIAQAALPSFSQQLAQRMQDAAVARYHKLQDLACLTTVPLLGAVLFAAGPALQYVFDTRIASMLLIPLALLCVGFFMHAVLYTPYVFSLAAGRPDISLRATMLALPISVAATVPLTMAFGLVGAAAAWIIYHVVVYLTAIPAIVRACLQLPPREWFAHFGKVSVAAGLSYGVAWVFTFGTDPFSPVVSATAYMSATGAFLACSWFIVSADFQEAIQALLRRPLLPAAHS